MRPLVLAGAMLLAAAPPAFAQAPAEPTGRFQIAPDEDGFVRLDTETGAMSHCAKSGGAWKCDVIAEDNALLAGRLDRLAAEVAALGARLDGLAARIEGLESPAAAPPAFPEEEELDRALGFMERLMQRFFEMVRQFKDEEPGARI